MITDRPEPDPLSQGVSLLRPQALAWRVVEAHGGWCLRLPATDAVVFGQMIEGSAQVEFADGSSGVFQSGDFLLMAAPAAWTMCTDPDAAPVSLEALITDPARLLSPADKPVITRFIAGAFVFAAPNAELLADLMLPTTHIHGAEVVAGRLGTLLRCLGDEALANRPGRSLILDRLLDIILVEAIRHRPAGLAAARHGLLAGLADPKIASALKLMHEDAQHGWTVAELARCVGMSRSSFAARFSAIVGLPPIDYLSRWRVSLAKSALTSSPKPMSEIAALAGYQSVSAFSTAFSRATGTSPTAYTRQIR